MSKHTYPPRLAKTVPDGLRLQSAVRDVWWRKQWILWLESLHIGARLGRGRNYAQLGQVRTLKVEPGRLSAEVQGAESAPYHVAVELPPLPEAPILATLKANPLFAAQLFTRALPMTFHEALLQQGLSLFPAGRTEMRFHCTCKDWARPCKHLAAMLCIFADAIGAEPLLLLRFRGIALPDSAPELTPTLLSAEALEALTPTPNAAAIPRRLGTLPYWRGSEDFRKSLEGAYRRAHERALQALDTLATDLRFPEDMVSSGSSFYD